MAENKGEDGVIVGVDHMNGYQVQVENVSMHFFFRVVSLFFCSAALDPLIPMFTFIGC